MNTHFVAMRPSFLLAAVLVVAQPVHAAFLTAIVNGNLPFGTSGAVVLTTQTADVVTTTGSQTQPSFDWNWHASSVARYGQLGAAADVSGTNMAGPENNARASGTAQFSDTWSFTDRPLDTVGQFRVTVTSKAGDGMHISVLSCHRVWSLAAAVDCDLDWAV